MPSKLFKEMGNMLSVEISSEISDEKFHAICNEIEQVTADMEKAQLALIMKHYLSFNSAEDLYHDLQFVKLYANRIDKVAVVCDKTWKQTWLGLFIFLAV